MKQYTHAHFILRCIEIARNGGKKVSPNKKILPFEKRYNEFFMQKYSP